MRRRIRMALGAAALGLCAMAVGRLYADPHFALAAAAASLFCVN